VKTANITHTLTIAITLITALYLSWLVLIAYNCFYPALYDTLNIADHIATYSPQNIYRHDFALTSKADHIIFFSAIVDAVTSNPESLSNIEYKINNQSTKLLTQAEIIHLNDVANLIEYWSLIGLSITLIWLVLAFYKPLHVTKKSLTRSFLYLLSGFLSLAVAIMIAGPTTVFYWAHTQVFPDNHQWFFYYQESLMTTLMKAPNIFGWILVIWLTIATALFILLIFTLIKIHHHQNHKR